MDSDHIDDASLQQELTSCTYLLTDINNVPELSTVTPIQALSYLNQSLENLILVYQSTSAFWNANDLDQLAVDSQSLLTPINGERDSTSMPSYPTQQESADTLENSDLKHTGTTEPNGQQCNPIPSDSSQAISELGSTDLSKSTSLSNVYLINSIKAATLSQSTKTNTDFTGCSGSSSSDSNASSSCNDGGDSSSNSSSSTSTISSDNSYDSTPHNMPPVTPKISADPLAILEEAAVVAAVLIEGAEQQRRIDKGLPIDSRVEATPRPTLQYNDNDDTNDNNELNKNDNETNDDDDDDDTTYNDANDSINPQKPTRSAVSQQEMQHKLLIIKRFWSKNAPPISIWDYLLRIHKFAPLSTSVYLSASLYVYRLCIELRTILLTPCSAHRIILASLRVASKAIEDKTYKQPRFAVTGGVRSADLYRLEIAFLFLIDFDICISSTVLQQHLVVLTELNTQANRHRQLLDWKRIESSNSQE